MFLLDPDLMDDRTSDASVLTDNRGKFRGDVIRRDGTCVMTGANEVQACHIIPHAKGHQAYVEHLLNHTSSSPQAHSGQVHYQFSQAQTRNI